MTDIRKFIEEDSEKFDGVYDVEIKFDKNGFCNRKNECINYEYESKCDGYCHFVELEGVDEKTYCDNFFKNFQNEKGLIVHFFEIDGFGGKRIEPKFENFCCATMKHFIKSAEFGSCDGGESPLQIEKTDPWDKDDETAVEIRLYRFGEGISFGKVLRFCPFCGKRPQIVNHLNDSNDNKEV